jgi:hypothetical protein
MFFTVSPLLFPRTRSYIQFIEPEKKESECAWLAIRWSHPEHDSATALLMIFLDDAARSHARLLFQQVGDGDPFAGQAIFGARP